MQNQPQNLVKAEDCLIHNLDVHLFLATKKRFRSHRRAFSLIEILVVISLIALLAGIGTAAALKMSAEARKEQTRSMMEGLLSANDEYKAVRQGSAISHTTPIPGLSSTEQFVAACLQIKTCEEIMISALNSSGAETFKRVYRNGDSDPFPRFSVYDRWGTEIEYRQSNDRTGNGPANENGDTVANNDLPLSRDPFFASAGPDKDWGTDDDITTIDQ